MNISQSQQTPTNEALNCLFIVFETRCLKEARKKTARSWRSAGDDGGARGAGEGLVRQELVEMATAGSAEARASSSSRPRPRRRTRRRARRPSAAASAGARSMLACEGDHAECVELLLTYHKTVDEDNMFLEPRAIHRRTFKTNVNARDARAGTAAISVFHKSKNALRLVLSNGGDPHSRTSTARAPSASQTSMTPP